MIEKIQKRTVFCSNSVFFSAVVIFCSFSELSCTDQKERPSPLKSDSTQLADIQMSIEYSSPGVRQRDIFGIGSGYLVPYRKLWRTGANKATSIHFDQDIIIDTVRINKGKYSIFSIPDAKTWEVIFNQDHEQWGSSYYQESLDVLRIRVAVKSFEDLEERMQFYFQNDSLKFRWEYIGWSIPFSNP